MRITLSPEQTDVLSRWAEAHARAEVDAGCEPVGYELVLAVGAVECTARARYGSKTLDLGPVQLETGR